MAAREPSNDFNLDPITKEPGAHPIGTGIGAAVGGAAAGAAAGAFGGPVGAAVGGIAGAVVGGLGGKASAEAINPTAEEAYWRDAYSREPYYQQGRSFDDYAPAYSLGLSGYNEYSGVFDQSEAQLANEWELRRGGSTLSWPEAREASRAAWNRVDANTTRNTKPVVKNDEVVDVLNKLLETSRDGEYGFRECAEHTDALDIKTLFNRRAEDCRVAATELQAMIIQYGGKADSGGTVSGALHRGWVSVRGTLAGYSDQAMLDECERGEDVALGHYRKALKQNLPADVISLVERQMWGVQCNHDEVKALRDALKASS